APQTRRFPLRRWGCRVLGFSRCLPLGTAPRTCIRRNGQSRRRVVKFVSRRKPGSVGPRLRREPDCPSPCPSLRKRGEGTRWQCRTKRSAIVRHHCKLSLSRSREEGTLRAVGLPLPACG